jgi:hypothetical protein
VPVLTHSTTNCHVFPSVRLPLQGHLFDTGLINQVLDLLEASAKEVPFSVVNCDVRPNNSSGAQYSRMALELRSEGKEGGQGKIMVVLVMTEFLYCFEATMVAITTTRLPL